MNLVALISQTWRITWRNWPLWALNLALFIVAIPAFTLGGALGGLGALLAMPTMPLAGLQPAWFDQLRAIPGWAWLMVSFVTLVLIVITSTGAWLLQAAAMRGAAIAAERGTFSLGEALHLGWPRVISLLQLSLTLGFLLSLISLAPFPLLFIARNSPFSLPLMEMAQVGLAPFSTILSIALLLVMMSIALEDVRPAAAMRRAWRVFGKGWWAFLLVIALSGLPSVALVFIMVPGLLVSAFTLALAPDFFPAVTITLCLCLSPIGLAIILFTAVFTVVLYTLVYREATRLLSTSV